MRVDAERPKTPREAGITRKKKSEYRASFLLLFIGTSGIIQSGSMENSLCPPDWEDRRLRFPVNLIVWQA